MTTFNRLDLSGLNGRLFVVGDIHGHFTLLEEKLIGVGFDKSTDILISVGDLVDRGPESHLAGFYATRSWFYFVRGNHEVMCLSPHGGTPWHVSNGGGWFHEMEPDKRNRMIAILNDAPYILEAVTPSGRLVGFVHASYPQEYDGSYDWVRAQEYSQNPQAQDEILLWDRYMVGRARTAAATGDKGADARANFIIKNVDHVYFGHTPLREPLTVGNCTWLDTGAFATGNLTVLEIS